MEPVIKVFGAKSWHSTVTIVGNRSGIQNLIDSLKQSIDVGISKGEFTETDGEYYDIEIKLFDHDSDAPEWNNLPMHYRDEIASTKNPKKWENLHNMFLDLYRIEKIKKIEESK